MVRKVKNMEKPLISIVMVNYNHEDFIRESIESVIAQTYQNWELIIVDDGSTDKSAQIIENYAKKDDRIRPFLQTENRHICVATNLGFSVVRGSYVARLDSDDVWRADKLEKQLAFMDQHPEGALCFTKLDLINGDGEVVNESEQTLYNIYNGRQENKKEWIRHFFFFGNTLIQSTLLMKREVLDTTGGFNVACVQGHDFDFFVRAIRKYDFIFLEEPLVKYRRIENQNSAWNERNNCRFFNEHMDIRYHFFDQMPDEMFREVFREDFVDPESQTHEELLCEQAFLLCRCIRGEEINPVLGLKKLKDLMQQPDMVARLEEKYHYTLKDFYEQMYRPMFVTEAMEGERNYMKNLLPMLQERVEALEAENARLQKQQDDLSEENRFLREENQRLEQSKLRRLTKPLRSLKQKMQKK